MPACHLEPADKRAFVNHIGKTLVERHGKKPYYKPSEVEHATRSLEYPIDWVCWAYCMFTTPQDFAALHAAAGEACDYVTMKAQMLTELASNGIFDWIDLDLSWLEWPDIDLSSIFDWFD